MEALNSLLKWIFLTQLLAFFQRALLWGLRGEGRVFWSLICPLLYFMWAAEIEQFQPTRAKQLGVSLSVCYTTVSQRCGAVCTVKSHCWHTQRTGGINTFLKTFTYILCVCVRVCDCVWWTAGPDWPNSNNNTITTQRASRESTNRNFGEEEEEETGRRTIRQEKRKWVVYVCHPHMYVCVCVFIASEQHILVFASVLYTCWMFLRVRLFSPGSLLLL